MTARISNQTRDRAIRVLDICADDRGRGIQTCTWDVVPSRSAADMAARDAFRAVCLAKLLDSCTGFLEAAALLRDNWNPGDPVEVRP